MKIRIIIMCVICIGLLGCSDKVQDVSTAQNDSVNMLDNKHYVDESEDLKSEFVERFLELSLFYGLSSPLNSEMICIFPYF